MDSFTNLKTKLATIRDNRPRLHLHRRIAPLMILARDGYERAASRTSEEPSSKPDSQEKPDPKTTTKRDTKAAKASLPKVDTKATHDVPKEDDETDLWGDILLIFPDFIEDLMCSIDRLDVRPGDMIIGDGFPDGRAYNWIVELRDAEGEMYLVRVPIHGRRDIWNDKHAAEWKAQACTVQYIKESVPSFPAPYVVDFDCTFDNPVLHPYMIMTHVDGQKVAEAWKAQPGETAAGPELEKKRLAILQSLATEMAKLQAIKFDKSGALYFPTAVNGRYDPVIGPAYVCEEPTRNPESWTAEYLPHSDEATSWLQPAISRWSETARETAPSTAREFREHGALLLFRLLVPLPARQTSSAPPFFGVGHPNLDWDNILVDEHTGTVVNFLNWDRVCSTPVALAWPSFPKWLLVDYDVSPTSQDAIEGSGSTPQELHRYRDYYARSLMEAVDCTGSGATHAIASASRHWSAIHGALVEGRPDPVDVARQLLTGWLPRVTVSVVLERLGNPARALRMGEEDWLQDCLKEVVKVDLGGRPF